MIEEVEQGEGKNQANRGGASGSSQLSLEPGERGPGGT